MTTLDNVVLDIVLTLVVDKTDDVALATVVVSVDNVRAGLSVLSLLYNLFIASMVPIKVLKQIIRNIPIQQTDNQKISSHGSDHADNKRGSLLY